MGSRGVVGQVQEQTHVVHRAVLLKVRLEEASRFHVDLEGWAEVTHHTASRTRLISGPKPLAGLYMLRLKILSSEKLLMRGGQSSWCCWRPPARPG